MEGRSRAKLVFAGVLLVVAAVLMCWNFGLFRSDGSPRSQPVGSEKFPGGAQEFGPGR